jgi:large repetitive protein
MILNLALAILNMKKTNNHISKSSGPSALKALGFAAVLALAVVVQNSSARADITNQATVNGSYIGNPVSAQSLLVSVPVVTTNLHMSVTKTADKTLNVVVGDVITYTYKILNDGNVTIHNISLADVHNASGSAPVPGSETLTDVPPLGNSTDATPSDGIWTDLAPGDTITFTATYTVTQSDVDNLQ